MEKTNSSTASVEKIISTTTNLNSGRSLQDYLSIGYIYLLILGITSDSIYYGLMGVNILSYSSVLDVILSPVNYLTKGIAFPIVILFIPAFSYFLTQFARKNYLKNREKEVFRSKNDIEKLDKSFDKSQLAKNVIVLSAFIVFSAYIGYGLGGGTKMKENLKNGTLTMKDKLTFSDGNVLKVRMIGHNSGYVFYVKEGGHQISITPIPGNIRVIEKLQDTE